MHKTHTAQVQDHAFIQMQRIKPLYIRDPAVPLKTPLGSVRHSLMLWSAGSRKAWCMNPFKLTKEWIPSNLSALHSSAAAWMSNIS